jgi:hypothetical protein
MDFPSRRFGLTFANFNLATLMPFLRWREVREARRRSLAADVRVLVTVGSAVLAAACASTTADVCQLQRPPADSRFRITHGVALATFPAHVTSTYTGCQRTWIGDHRYLDGMHILATAYFESGGIVRFAGAQPDGLQYDCKYVKGSLSAPASVNPQHCPLRATELEEAWQHR